MSTSNGNIEIEDYSFSDSDFHKLASLAHTEYGLSLSESKKPLVYSRLSRRLRQRGVSSFQEYLALISKASEKAERLELISALTTNVTSFFRETHHFETLKKHAKDVLVPHAKAGGRVRIWSSACSSGQEAYSIALTLLEVCPDAWNYDIRILATDIDPAIIRKARNAAYPIEELNSIPERFHQTYTHQDQSDSIEFRLSEVVTSLVTFAELNLISNWPFKGLFDVIFCRNVAIYFDQETQKRLWAELTGRLTNEGILFIGHSERISGPAASSLSNFGVTSYQKLLNAEA